MFVTVDLPCLVIAKERMSTVEIVCAIFAIGILSGLRALSPIAVVCWLALLHRLALTGWASFVGSKVAVVSVSATGEVIDPARCGPR